MLIGISGGTASGKTRVARKIQGNLPSGAVLVVPQDAYYRDQADLAREEREKTNYDHPSAFDSPLFVEHLKKLTQGFAVEQPTYDFVNHTRSARTIRREPRQVIIVEGILTLSEPSVRELLDMRIYVEADADERFIRRMQRDIAERGRTLESVIRQYQTMVRPMHLQFVEPSKRYADVIIPFETENPVAIDLVTTKIQSILAQ
ncbi:MAG TPA: uridine kinase [Candidatus Baltobacteraceae bacterium]|jgi:uridine kinase|nr:uridine kinase [Candidatus Baltobacteraceae bacterium]